MLCVSVHPKTPVLTVTPPNATVASGIQLLLMCTTKSIGAVTYTFLNSGTLLGTPGPNNTYTLKSPSYVAPGKIEDYSCMATMKEVNSSVSNIHSVKVVGK